jgi:hypothetical protein
MEDWLGLFGGNGKRIHRFFGILEFWPRYCVASHYRTSFEMFVFCD